MYVAFSDCLYLVGEHQLGLVVKAADWKPRDCEF